MAALMTLLCFAAIGYAYLGYPLLLVLLTRLRGDSLRPQPADPRGSHRISVIIAARNEAAGIRAKLENTLALRRGSAATDAVQILVASDASDDGTDQIVQEYAPQGVKLVRSPERRGKEWAQSLAVREADGDIILFTDAKVWLESDAIGRIVPWFDDPEVGAVSSRDRVESPEGGGSGEGMYVRYEMWLRKVETAYRTLVGLSGSCFAVRREICAGIRTDIPSDFALLLECASRGLRGVLASDVICTYKALTSEEQEFHRKVRTILRGITTLFTCAEVMNPRRYHSFAYQVISHKLMRWLVPWFFVGGAIGSLCLASNSLLFVVLADGVLGLFVLAFFAYAYPSLRGRPLFKVPLFFLVTNAAIAVAWTRYLLGERSVAWTPSAKGA